MKFIFTKLFAKILIIASLSLFFYSCNPNVNDILKEVDNNNEEVGISEQKKEPGKQKISEKPWDWTKPESYDFAYSMINGKKSLSSPFHTTASVDTKLTDIIMARDYLPEQGWVLLAKVFGSPDNYIQSKYPYFILYNKYLGIIRLYIFNGERTNYKQAAITLSWLYGTNKNALFSPSEVYRYPNEEYHSGNRTAGTIVNYLENYNSGAWFVTDMPVNYDPHINYNENLTLRFRITNEAKGIVHLNSEFEFETKTETRSITTNSGENAPNSKVYKFLDKGHKVLSATSSEKIEEYYNKVNTALDPGKFKGHERLQKATESVRTVLNGKDLKNPLRAIGAISTVLGGPIGTGLGLLSSFLGKSNSMSTQPLQLMPMVSIGRGNGFGTITGDIIFDTNATAFPLQLPGANHTYKKDSAINIDGLPIYDKPLGVIGLDNTPYLGHSESKTRLGRYEDRDCPKCIGWGCIDNISECNEFRYREWGIIYHGYKIDDDLIFKLNPYSDTEIITVKARLLSKSDTSYSTEPENLITKKIESGEYELIESDKDWFVYGTPFTDLSGIKKQILIVYYRRYDKQGHGKYLTSCMPYYDEYGTNIGCMDLTSCIDIELHNKKNDNPIYVQFLIALKPKDPTADQTPIIHNITYHLDKKKIR